MPKMTEVNLSDDARAMTIRHQQFAWAIKVELGFQICGVPNDSLVLSSGKPADPVRAMELAAMAPIFAKDLIYLGFRTIRSKEPSDVALAFRDDLCVDWRAGLKLYSADHDAPLILVDVVRGEHYARGGRNQLVRQTGVPADLVRGHKRAMARVRRTAAIMKDTLNDTNYFVPAGENVADHMPEPQGCAVIRLA